MIINDSDKTLQKIKDLICYALPQIDKFPRTEKGYAGVATKLRHTFFCMAQHCLDSKKVYYQKSLLKELNELDKQIAYGKFYTTIAYEIGLFNFKKFQLISDYLEQIGKMTGSWIKRVKDNP